MAQMLHKLLNNKLNADVAQNTSMAEMVHWKKLQAYPNHCTAEMTRKAETLQKIAS